MRLRAERDSLLEVVSTVARAVSGRSGTSSVLSGLHLEQRSGILRATATDLDLTISAEVAVAGDSDGACVVPARLVTDIVRSLAPGALLVDADDDELRVNAGRSQFSVRTYPVEDFPHAAIAEPPAGEGVTLEAAAFADALRQVVRAASSDDARPILTGVLMAAEADGLRLVATDSYRLAVRDVAGASVLREGQRVLVPSRALAELQRLLSGQAEVALQLGEHAATFRVGSVRLTTRLIEGEFPNYRQLIPEGHPNRVVVAKEALLDAVRRVKLLAGDATTPARLALSADAVNLSVVRSEVGQASEDVDAKFEGADLTVAFNPAYLVEGVEAVAGDEVSIEIAGALRPAVVRDVGDEAFLYLLMPVRVS